MKNIIPLVVAVILGLAAVFAVSRTLSKDSANIERKVNVVVTSRTLEKNETITEAYIHARSVAVSSHESHYVFQP